MATWHPGPSGRGSVRTWQEAGSEQTPCCIQVSLGLFGQHLSTFLSQSSYPVALRLGEWVGSGGDGEEYPWLQWAEL